MVTRRAFLAALAALPSIGRVKVAPPLAPVVLRPERIALYPVGIALTSGKRGDRVTVQVDSVGGVFDVIAGDKRIQVSDYLLADDKGYVVPLRGNQDKVQAL